MRTKLQTRTCGDGLWSEREKNVNINKVILNSFTIYDLENDPEDMYGELCATFNKKDWDVEKHGLIYTDSEWLKTFRKALRKKYKLSLKAVEDIHYSEQGMQGKNYISMDVGVDFIKEWANKGFLFK